jgi:formamidopyrimidine-DNA glycosylase
MPELPDIELYLHALRPRVVGRRLVRIDIVSPSVLRTFEPPVEAAQGKTIVGVSRMGKRLVFELQEELHIVVHLMIAGRWRWLQKPGGKWPPRITMAGFVLENGRLALVESSTQKRSSVHLVKGREAVMAMDPGGLDVMACTPEDFAAQLRSENHTVKRSLTDRLQFDGIGNAYSDEILHAARLSPLKWTTKLSDEEISRLHAACREVLGSWTQKLTGEFGTKFPGAGDMTAFRPDFAVHGKFGQPCPVCGAKVQRIRYAGNETNYCPKCQTEGVVLADRSLSRLLKDDWPREAE